MEYKNEIVIKNEKLIVRTYTMPVGSVIKPTEPVLDVYMRNNLSVDFNIQLPTGTVVKQEIKSVIRPLTPDNYEFFNEQKVKEYLISNNFTKEEVYHIALAGYAYPIIYSRIVPISVLSILVIKNLHDTLVSDLKKIINNLTTTSTTDEKPTVSNNEATSTISSSAIIIGVMFCVFILLLLLAFYMKGK